MSALRKVSIVALIKSSSVEFYTSSSAQGQKLELPANLIQNQEILDQSSLESLIKDFLLKNNLPKHTEFFLILGQGTYYEKMIPASDPENESFEIEKFIEEVPFEPPNIARSVVKVRSGVFAFAAYKNFFYPFVQIFNDAGWETKGVIPITALGIQDTANGLTRTDVALILKNGHVGKKADLMHREVYDKSRRSVHIVVGAVCALVVVTIAVVAITHSPKPSLSAKPNASPPKRAGQALTRKATIPAKPHTDFEKPIATVKVLNGTGREGEAGEVKDLLASLGFKDIQTDNASQKGQTKTQVTVLTDVPPDVRKEIVNLLKKTFSQVELAEKATAEATIVVTTGSR